MELNSSQQKLSQQLTDYVNNQYPGVPWTRSDSDKQILQGSKSGSHIAIIGEYSGQLVRLQITGNTILVDGKDITGNLGSQTTYGDHSPIIVGNSGTVYSENKSTGGNVLEEIEVGLVIGIVLIFLTYFINKWLKKGKL